MTTQSASSDTVARMNARGDLPIPTCHVGGHSLIRRGREWIDAAIPSMPQAPRVRLHIGSREFIELLYRFPKLVSLVAISHHLQLALGGTVYEIYE